MRNIVTLLFFILLQNIVNGQNENSVIKDSIFIGNNDKKIDWDMSFSLKSSGYYRGVIPSHNYAPAMAMQLGVKYHDFILGMYGGAAFNGHYNETDLFLIYYKPKWDVRLEWFYNFTEGITNIPTPSGFFDFDPEATRGMLDFIINIKPNKHLTFTSSTYLFGRDRLALPEDLENDVPLRRGEQLYSQYINASYNWYWNDTKVEANIGGTFSWVDFNGPTFLHHDGPGITDIGISFKRKLFKNTKLNIPIKLSAHFNPADNNAYLIAKLMIIQISKL